MPVINTFWMGSRLGSIEIICLLSFLRQGHSVRLFCYEPVGNVPAGVEIVDANEILAREKFRLHISGNPALGANQFRYLLLRRGLGLWADMDVLLLRPVPLPDASSYLFGLEDEHSINNAVLYLPPDAKITLDLCAYVENDYPVPPNFSPEEQEYYRAQIAAGTPVPVSEMRWGVYGPQALSYFVRKHGLFDLAQPPEVFYPVYWDQPDLMVAAGYADHVSDKCTEKTIGIHMWNSQIRYPWKLRPNNPVGLLVIEEGSFLDQYARSELDYFIHDVVSPMWQDKKQASIVPKGYEESNAGPLCKRPADRPRITLNMICKHEEDLIGACLESVKPFIDQWVIAIDSQSTDRTSEVILQTLADIPGRLYTHEWVDFSSNRNQAIVCAEAHSEPGDYLLFMDADDEFIAPDGFTWPSLDASFYYSLLVGGDDVEFYRGIMVRVGDGWKYKYRIHEVLDHKNYKNIWHDTMADIKIIHRQAGTRSKTPCRYLRDAFLLEQDLVDQPNEPRCMFYLAQSYEAFGLLSVAVDYYEKRFAITDGNQDERFLSLLRIADIKHTSLAKNWGEVMADYLRAWEFMPQRIEPLARIMAYYSGLGGHDHIVAMYGQMAMEQMKKPRGGQFLESDLYDYVVKDRYAVALYWCQRYEDAICINEQLLSENKLPADNRERVMHNLQACRERLGTS